MDVLKNLIDAAKGVLNNPDNTMAFVGLEEAVAEAEKFLDVRNKIPTPLFDRIVVKPFEAESRQGLMILPMSDNQHFGVLMKKGKEVEDVTVDEVVFWTNDMGETLTVDGEDFILAPFRELKAIVR
jgi:co-chaperonin GroES (HSP10)